MFRSIIISLVVAVAIVGSYQTKGNYTEKTAVYDQVLDLEQECEQNQGIFNHGDFSCMHM